MGIAVNEQFYADSQGERRAMQEQRVLATQYPGFEMDVDDDGTPYVHGWIGPNASLKGRYHLLLLLPPGYGRGVMPIAHMLEPELRPGTPHRYQDGALCLDHSGAFSNKSTIVTFLAWVSVWLVMYEDWLDTGNPW